MYIDKWIFNKNPKETGKYLAMRASKAHAEMCIFVEGPSIWIDDVGDEISDVYAYADMPKAIQVMPGAEDYAIEAIKPYFIMFDGVAINLSMVGLVTFILDSDGGKISFWRQNVEDEDCIETWYFDIPKEYYKAREKIIDLSMIKSLATLDI
jgi:hypothetical protein